MKIVFDHQIFSAQTYGGIARYFYEIYDHIDKLEGMETELPLWVSNNAYLLRDGRVRSSRFFPNFNFRGRHSAMVFINNLFTLKNLRSGEFDLFHPTYYDPYFLDVIGTKPFVLTIHDMIHEKYPRYFTEKDSTVKDKRLLVEKAAHIIAVSEHTKKDIIEILGVEASRISVIYHGNSLPSPPQGLDMHLPSRYLLYVGPRNVYKNFNNFSKAVSILFREESDLFLVCAGGGDWSAEERILLDSLGIADRVYRIDVDDRSLAHLFANAEMFVFPSYYEGFGIPVLEAFACGCPVACSDTSSLPEVAGTCAEYFDPRDSESICESIKKLLYDRERREMLVKCAMERVKLFSWESAAKQTASVYSGVLTPHIDSEVLSNSNRQKKE